MRARLTKSQCLIRAAENCRSAKPRVEADFKQPEGLGSATGASNLGREEVGEVDGPPASHTSGEFRVPGARGKVDQRLGGWCL
jgi:hypothetical protein